MKTFPAAQPRDPDIDRRDFAPAQLLLPPQPQDGLSDQRLKERIVTELKRSGYLPLRGLNVEVDAGCVRLRGCVPSYYHKQLAQSLVTRTPDVRQLISELEVKAAIPVESPVGVEPITGDAFWGIGTG